MRYYSLWLELVESSSAYNVEIPLLGPHGLPVGEREREQENAWAHCIFIA